MPRKQPTTLAECNAELELAQKQLRQYQNREKVLTRKLFVEERRIRTHRLCARGGYLESIVTRKRKTTFTTQYTARKQKHF